MVRFFLSFIAIVAFFVYLAVGCIDANGAMEDVEIMVPPTIEECRTDMECDIAARILCEQGLDEWCVYEER